MEPQRVRRSSHRALVRVSMCRDCVIPEWNAGADRTEYDFTFNGGNKVDPGVSRGYYKVLHELGPVRGRGVALALLWLRISLYDICSKCNVASQLRSSLWYSHLFTNPL